MINKKAFLTKAVEEGFKNKVNGYPLTLKHSKGRKLLDYKIYGNSVQDGTPTPDNPIEIQSVGELVTDTSDSNYGKYKIPVTVTGKNYNKTLPIHKYDYSLDYKKYNSTNIAILPKGTYTLSGDYMPTIQFFDINTNERILVPDAVTYNKNFVYSAWDNYALTPTTTFVKQATITVLKDLKITLASTVGELGEFQIEEGNKATEYEPYIEPKTTNIYLNEPLRKLGEYADYIDFKNKKIVRNIKESQINNSSLLNKFGGVKDYSAFFMIKNDLLDYGEEYKYNPPVRSNTFKFHPCGIANSNNSWTRNYQIGASVTANYKRMCFTLPNTITDIASAKEWLTENPIDYFYITSEPDDTETIELPNIPTNKGTNIITVDTTIQPSKIEAEYNSFEKEV